MTEERKTLADQIIADTEQVIAADERKLAELSREFFGVKDYVDPDPLPPPKTPTRRRRTTRDPDLAALAKFARAVENMTPPARRAAIAWLADKYLGIRLPGDPR